MRINLADSLAIGILVASIEAAALMPVTASIKTMFVNDIKWEEVVDRLIEKVKMITTSTKGTSTRANAAHTVCQICNKTIHATDLRYLDLLGQNLKLDILQDQLFGIFNNSKTRTARSKNWHGKYKTDGDRSFAARSVHPTVLDKELR